MPVNESGSAEIEALREPGSELDTSRAQATFDLRYPPLT